MRFLIHKLVLGLLVAGTAGIPRAYSDGTLDIKEAPSKKTWQYFLALDHSSHQQIWQIHKSGGATLKDWSWTWRLAWLKVCSRDTRSPCEEILRLGLRDPAMVVRARAAEIFGLLFEGTGDQTLVRELASVYDLSGNSRHGKALAVRYRILNAINQIGGADAKVLGEKLASSEPSTLSYWRKLQKSG